MKLTELLSCSPSGYLVFAFLTSFFLLKREIVCVRHFWCNLVYLPNVGKKS